MTRCRSLLIGLLATLFSVVANGAQYSSNMFLNGQYQNGIETHPETHFSVNPASNIFLEHAIISRQAQPFQGPTYLPPKEYLTCNIGQQCVRRNQCSNGYYTQQLPKIQNCEPETDICCTYRAPPTTTTPTPYITCTRDSDCVSPRDCRNGEIIATNYIKKQSSNRCYAPELCCRMPSTTLTDDGYIFNLPEKQFPLPTNPTVQAQRTTQPQPAYQPQPTQPAYRPQPTQAPIQPAYRPQPTQAPIQPIYRPQPTKPTNEYLPPQPTPARQTPAQRPLATFIPIKPDYRPQPTKPTNEYLPPQPTPPRQAPVAIPQPIRPAYQPQATQPAYRPPQPQTTRPAYRPQPQPTQRPTNSYLPPVSENEIPRNEQPQILTPQRPQRPATAYEADRLPQPSNEKPIYRGEDQLSPQIFPEQKAEQIAPAKYFAKCASALVCTEESFCNSIGVITDTPVELTRTQAAFRVPLTDCLLPGSGAPGKCCRDSNYVDPWPVNLAGVCATRNKNTKPSGIKDIDANFAEIPWQAMILKESSKSLLCGGAVIGDQFVVTTAKCVNGVSVNDIRIKVGEYELGSTSEPLPFQLITAKTIDTHPEYNPSTGAHNLAIIRLEKRLEFATNIQPICISDEDPSPSEQCVTTGWGKQALRIHEEGAILHVTSTSILSRSDCGADDSSVCAATKFDSCEFDSGSALACGSGSNVRLKGIYTDENGCGEGQAVRFSKPDVKWINTAFADRNKPLLQKRV